MADLTGALLQNNYFLRELIGSGATADVYLAWDKVRITQLAIKVLHENLAADARFQKMFRQEAEFMRELRHPNIVRLFDFGEDKAKARNKIVFIAMEYIRGPNLRGLLSERKKPLSLAETSQILAAVCKALHFAHRSKVLHCDVKPANILIAQNERQDILEKEVFLADFGISHWALQQKRGGTPAYMAPELFTGATVTEQTDIYALGVTLYEMLSGGHLPFRGETGSQGSSLRERIAWEIAHKPLPPLQQFNSGLSGPILTVVEKALNKDPKLRYTSAIEIWNEFERASNGKMPEKLPLSEQKTILRPPPISQPHTPSRPIRAMPDAKARLNQPHLFGMTGEKAGEIIPIPKEELTIGRNVNNILCFEDRTVSRFHATIFLLHRAYYIRDEDSRLGTYLNGRQIPANTSILIKEGDRIEIGHSQSFEFRLRIRTKGAP